MVDVANYTFQTLPHDLGGGLRNTAHQSVETVGMPISLLAYPGPQLKLEISYNSSFLDTESITEALRSLANLLAAIPDKIHLPIAIAQADLWTNELEMMAAQIA